MTSLMKLPKIACFVVLVGLGYTASMFPQSAANTRANAVSAQPLPEFDVDIADGFRTGKYISPLRSGVAYMLSGDIRNFNPQTGKVESFPPHVMFYAPNLTNADLGTTREALKKDPSLPFVAYEGPHGYIIVLAGDKQKIAT